MSFMGLSRNRSPAEELMPEVKDWTEPIGRACPDCGHELVIRWGRYGKFISAATSPTAAILKLG
jgi:DNA topoisomerase-1